MFFNEIFLTLQTMEYFGQIVLNGIIIGILISAPMGPVGMLVIQRTLNKGRWPALFTGIGAGISDVLYSMLCGLGLSFATDFIEQNEILLQIVGSIFLIGFAIYLFQKNPSRSLQKSKETKTTFWKDFITGFLFTFSNPLILFFIMGLFGRFNFILPEFVVYHYAIAFVSIFAGTFVWWYFITYAVNKLRNRFNVRSMWTLNRIIGGVLAIMAIVGIYKSVFSIIDEAKSETEMTVDYR